MISIIIPVFNVEQYIITCLESVEAQTYTDYEVILVDDCGTDKSMMLIRGFIKKSKISNKIRIISNEQNLGPSAARNNGTEHARGTYILYLDSDDTLMPECLEKLVETAKRTDSDIIIGNFRLVGEDKWIPRFCDKEDSYTYDAFLDYLKGNYYLMVWNKLIRRDIIAQNNISFPVGIHHGEDSAWSFSLACIAKKVAYVPDVIYNYFIRTDGLHANNNFSYYFDSYIFLLRHYYNEALKYKKMDDPMFRWWYERQKALCFAMTKNAGSEEQLRHIYSIIRQNMPQGSWNKTNIHYLLPEKLGFLAYKKWHGMWLI